MGQTLGKAKIKEDVLPFINLPQSLVHDVRQTIYEVAEGYGLTLEEFQEVVRLCLGEFLRIPESNIDEYSTALFGVFCGDEPSEGSQTQLVDSFQVISTLCLCSGMELDQKIHFLFDVFDFSESGDLNLNETTLALRTVISGANKIVLKASEVDLNFIDHIAIEAYDTSSTTSGLNLSVALAADDGKLNRLEFFNYVFDCAETKALLDHFNDLNASSEVSSANNVKLSTKPTPLRFNTASKINAPCSNDAPWRDQIRFLKQQNDQSDATPPTTSLSLDWIYGRNTKGPDVLCGADGCIYYPAGTNVIKLSFDKTEQHYFTQHTGDVTSIDIMQCKDMGEIVASADAGYDCKICIWSTSEMASSIVVIPRFHQDGIAKLNFSPSGDLLLTLGNNVNTIAVYQWRTKALIFTAKVPDVDVYDCKFLSSNNSFGVCGSNSIHFWNRFDETQQYTQSRGVFNRLSTKETMSCIAFCANGVVSGSWTGRLWLWEGRVCLKQLHALHSPITCLKSCQTCDISLCASTHDAMVYLLNSKFEVTRKLSLDIGCGSIDNLYYNLAQETILICQGNSFYETNIKQQQELARHDIGQNMASSFTPLKNDSIASISDNGDLLLLDTNQHSVVDRVHFDFKLSCIAYSEVLDQVAIGLASGHKIPLASKSFIILKNDDLKTTVIHSGCNAQKSLSVCKYSNDGQFLAFGSEDFGIYIHLCTEKFPLVAKCRGHTGLISSIDFGSDNNCMFLRSNSYDSGEAMFWRVSDGKSQTPMSQRQTTWETQSCALCWSLEGVHNDVVVSSCCLNGGQNPTLFVGDKTGHVRVYCHPVVKQSPLSLTYAGHSDCVTGLFSSQDTSTIYSIGDSDACIFQWKCTNLDWKIHSSLARTVSDESKSSLEMTDVVLQLEELDFTKRSGPKQALAPRQRLMPWKRSITAPSNSPPVNSELPDGTLCLEKVHGYNANVSNSLHCISTGNEILYSIGKVLVRFSVEESSQRFYIANDKILCLAFHQSTSICAVASQSRVVEIVDLNTMKSIRRNELEAVCMDFDSTGRHLALLSNEMIFIFDWKNQVLVCSSETFNSVGTCIKFFDDLSIAECSLNNIRLWTYSSRSGSMAFEDVVMHDEMNNDSFCCLDVEGDGFFVGSSSGQIVKFSQKELEKRIKGHTSSVTSITASEHGLVTASINDGFVKVWNLQLRCLMSINTRDFGIKHGISAAVWDHNLNTITIGNEGGEIWQLISSDGSITNNRNGPITKSHSPAGLTINPSGYSFATCGDDGLLCFWSIFDNECQRYYDIKSSARACAFSPDGRLMAVGMGNPNKENARVIDGKWVVINIHDGSFQVLAERRDSRKHITNIKWSGSRIAVGSSDSRICVYEISSKTTPATKVELLLLSVIELKSCATHFDFSKDAKYLRVNTDNRQLEFYEAGPGVHIEESSRLKDIVWDSETCPYGWNTQGVWSPFDDGSEVLSIDCNVHNNNSSLVCGDSNGCLKLFQYPCTTNQTHCIQYAAHVGPVGYVRWFPGGSHMVSTGKHDHSIMIWKHNVGSGIFSLADVSDMSIKDTSSKAHHNDLFIHTNTELVCDSVSSVDQQQVAKLIHLQGYQSNLLGNSAFYDCHGEVKYPVSNLVTTYDRKTNGQTFFMKHDTTISAICTSRSTSMA